MQEDNTSIIIDIGSDNIKVGLNQESSPHIFPSVIGYQNKENINEEGKEEEENKEENKNENTGKDFYVGSEALENQDKLSLCYPFEKGILDDFDSFQNIWNNIFDKILNKNSNEYNVLLAGSPFYSKENKIRIAEIMFEEFNIPGLYIVLHGGSLSIMSQGYYNGTVIESGDSFTHIIPVFDGVPMEHAVNSIKFGGKDISNYLLGHAKSSYKNFIKYSNVIADDIIKIIKEEKCYVKLKSEEKPVKTEFGLPDGSIIEIGEERALGPECLFHPQIYMLNKHQKGIHELCYDSISKCDNDIKNYFYNLIVLSGGNCMFSGLKERLENEMRYLLSKDEIRVKKGEKDSIWFGGSFLSKLNSFESIWITKEEFEEYGDSIILKKCYF